MNYVWMFISSHSVKDSAVVSPDSDTYLILIFWWTPTKLFCFFHPLPEIEKHLVMKSAATSSEKTWLSVYITNIYMHIKLSYMHNALKTTNDTWRWWMMVVRI